MPCCTCSFTSSFALLFAFFVLICTQLLSVVIVSHLQSEMSHCQRCERDEDEEADCVRPCESRSPHVLVY